MPVAGRDATGTGLGRLTLALARAHTFRRGPACSLVLIVEADGISPLGQV